MRGGGERKARSREGGRGEGWRAGGALTWVLPKNCAVRTQALPSCRTRFPVCEITWSKALLRSELRWGRGERGSLSPPNLLSSPPLRESGQGRGKGRRGWGPSPPTRAPWPSARRELTRSLGIYHAPNYNVNWQVPEIN